MTFLRYFGRNRRDTERRREMEAHLAIEMERNLARGVPPAEARRLAYVKFGSPTVVRESANALPIDGILQDLRYAVRQIRHAPTFAAVTILTIALGIGANTAIFSAMHVALLRLLPVRGADRLVLLHTTDSIQSQSGDGDTSLTYHIFEMLRPETQVFASLVAFAPLNTTPVSVRYRGPAEAGAAEEAQVELVSGDFFSGLGVAPALGRVLTRADETAHDAVAVLRYEYWVRRFNHNPAVVGATVLVRGEPFLIVGVAARRFSGAEHERVADLWIPLQTRQALQPWNAMDSTIYGTAPRWWALKVIGRLQASITPAQAVAAAGPIFDRAALDGITRHLAAEDVPHLFLTPVRGIDGMQDDFGQALTTLMVMVALVLIMACLNIGTLLVVRGSARTREFTLRQALGAGRGRLARQLFVESAVLVATGSALAWAFALWATRALAAWAGLDLDFAPDSTVLLATLAASVLVTVGFALAPLSRLGRLDPSSSLRTWGGPATQSSGRGRLRELTLATQIAMCLVLLVGGALLVRSLGNLEQVDLGMRTDGLFVFGLASQDTQSDADAVQFFDSVLARLRAVPGVEAVTLTRNRLGSGWSSNTSLRIDGAPPTSDAHLRYNSAGPDFVRTFGATLIAGRDLRETDGIDAPKVALVNATLARQYFGGQRALGHTISSASGPARTIVGIVADMKYTGSREDARSMAWYPYSQTPGISTMNVELRSTIPMNDLMPAVRRAVHELAPDVALLRPMTQTQQFELSYADTRLAGRLAMLFGLLAVLLVATGLYGTLAYTVSRRTAEIGVRMALGARRSQVVWQVLRRSLVAVGAGLAVGLVLARIATSFLASMLFGVRATDPRFSIAAVTVLLGFALVASVVPVARAASISPVTTVRQD